MHLPLHPTLPVYKVKWIEYLLCARHYAKPKCMSFNLHNHTIRKILLLFLNFKSRDKV